MPVNARHTAIWLIALFFAFVSALGEGLHLVPGCGHYVEMSWGFLAVGVRPPPSPSPSDGRKRVEQPSRGPVRVLQRGQCPICSVVAQVKQSAKNQRIESSTKFVTLLAPRDSANSARGETQAFRARAPPVG